MLSKTILTTITIPGTDGTGVSFTIDDDFLLGIRWGLHLFGHNTDLIEFDAEQTKELLEQFEKRSASKDHVNTYVLITSRLARFLKKDIVKNPELRVAIGEVYYSWTAKKNK